MQGNDIRAIRSCCQTSSQRANGLDEAGSDMSVGTVWPAAATLRPRALSGCLRKRSQMPRPGHVERKTLKRVNCCDRERLNGAIGCRAPIEKADEFNRQQNGLEKAAQVLNKNSLEPLGDSNWVNCDEQIYFIRDACVLDRRMQQLKCQSICRRLRRGAEPNASAGAASCR